jgi:hypothetical protein
MANALKKITTRAKQLQKEFPNTAWKNLIKKAGADYRNGNLGAGSSRKRSKPKKKSVTVKRSKNIGNRKTVLKTVTKSKMNVTTAKGFIRSEYKDQLAALLLRNSLLPSKGNKMAKRKLQTSISEKKRQLKKLD